MKNNKTIIKKIQFKKQNTEQDYDWKEEFDIEDDSDIGKDKVIIK